MSHGSKQIHKRASVRLSVAIRYCVETAQHIVEILSPPDISNMISLWTNGRYEILTVSPVTGAFNTGGAPQELEYLLSYLPCTTKVW